MLVALQHRYGIDSAEAAHLMKAVPVIHLHGTLGDLGDVDLAADKRPYSSKVTSELIQSAARKINVVHEDIGHYPEFERGKELLRAAEEIWFLGFGYLRENVERLGKANFTAAGRIGRPRLYGTAYGLENSEKARAFVALGTSLNVGEIRDDILMFLRKSWT